MGIGKDLDMRLLIRSGMSKSSAGLVGRSDAIGEKWQFENSPMPVVEVARFLGPQSPLRPRNFFRRSAGLGYDHFTFRSQREVQLGN